MDLFRTAQKPPPTISTDTIVPVHFFDDNSIFRSVLLYLTLRFDHVLDPEKLRHGLEKLMEHGYWRKLGARVRVTDKKKLEYHIPATFSDARPGFIYSHVIHNTSIQDHPVASHIPRPTDQIAVYSDLDNLKDLAHRIDGPKRIEDFLCSDEPQLSLHVVTFEDATLVSISWMHTMMDALAMSSFLNAWVFVLNGQDSEVPPVSNFDKDPLATLGTAPTESHILSDLQLTGLNLVQFSSRYISELMFYKDSARTIYIPGHLIQAMKASAMEQLSSSRSFIDSQSTASKPFVSEGDVLCAFLTRLAVMNETPHSTRQISIQNPVSLRSILSSSLLPPAAGVCLSNAVLVVTTLASAGDILSKPLAYTASYIRKSITEQTTPSQVDALAALHRTAVERTGRPPVFGDGGTRMVTFSNWTKAEFFKLDFGAAVVRDGRLPDGDKLVVTPSFVNASGESNGLSPRGSWPILGKDESGGYWVQGNLRSDLWEAVENKLREMAK